jgi:hypothetical protein
MSSIDTCWTCGNSAIEEREIIALAVQKRHDDGSDFNKEWSNHHGLDRCDCDELVEFIRGLKNDALCNKYGCDYQLDLDGQVTCSNCGAMDDDMLPRRTYNENEAGTIEMDITD